MNNKKLNKSKEAELTIDKLRKFEGFENIEDGEANEILKTFDSISSLIYDCFQKQILKK